MDSDRRSQHAAAVAIPGHVHLLERARKDGQAVEYGRRSVTDHRSRMQLSQRCVDELPVARRQLSVLIIDVYRVRFFLPGSVGAAT